MATLHHLGAHSARILNRDTIMNMKRQNRPETPKNMRSLNLPRLFQTLRGMFARRVIVARILPNDNAVRVTVLAEDKRPRRWR